jgi:hypothetical protein
MGLNTTNFAALLKETFDDREVARMVFKKNKLLGLMPKIKKFGGKGAEVPFVYGDPQSIGPFANAQAAKTSTQTQSSQFFLTRKKKYGIVTIDGETIKASEGNDAAFLSARETEIKGIFNGVSRDLAIDLARDGSGVLGTYASGAATATITLQNRSDTRNFESGMWVNLVQSGAVVGAPVKVQLSAVDTGAGTLSMASSNWNTVFGVTLAAGDQIVRDGCYNACVEGLASYLPAGSTRNTKLAASFYGVTRTANPTRQGGVVIPTVAGQPIEEIAIDLLMAVGAEGGSPDTLMLSFENVGSLIKALGAKKEYTVTPGKRMAIMPDGSEADIGYSALHVIGGDCEVDVIADNTIPPDRMYALQMDTWAFRSMGDAPGFLDLDDNRLLRESGSDGYELRIGYYANVQCNAPGWNGVAVIS